MVQTPPLGESCAQNDGPPGRPDDSGKTQDSRVGKTREFFKKTGKTVPASGPEFFRIIAAGDELADALHHHRTVFAISHAEPRIMRAQNFHFRLAGDHEI